MYSIYVCSGKPLENDCCNDPVNVHTLKIEHETKNKK